MMECGEEGVAAVEAMVAQIDAQIDRCEARGWLRAAAKGEELICCIYAEAGIAVPDDRGTRIASIMHGNANGQNIQ
jgi:hypothetical protein